MVLTGLVGWQNGLELNAGTSATGTAFADLSGYSLTFSGMEAEQMLSIDAADVTAIHKLIRIFTFSFSLFCLRRGRLTLTLFRLAQFRTFAI